jgi:hypothetical protein
LMCEFVQQCGTLVDPIKTTVVQDLRCMTTWVLRKEAERDAHAPGVTST